MSESKEEATPGAGRSNFIKQIIEDDLARDRVESIVTRFPPEPNGYLHIGHAKSICLNFGLAEQYHGRCHLRFDDTNPSKEEVEYVESIKRDVQWLGFDWGEHLYFASDYFERMYALAEHLIARGKAYVESADRDTMRAHRGTLSEPGRPTPDRARTVEENLDLFRRMRAGEFPDGAYVLRAKIDLANPNMLMRDPVLYRIQHAHHHNTGDAWPIYPMYDYAHCLEDAFEHVTHSICTLEFENNRELYDWVIEHTEVEHVPHQYEFARLALNYTVMSKRKLLRLVKEGYVTGWDDPRMPTIAGLRRRGIRPEAIRKFAELIGVAKANSTVEVELLEYAIRDDLNHEAPRVMCVTDPLKVTLTNFPEDEVDWLDCPYWPHDVPREGERKVPFTRELFIEREDFAQDPPKGWFRLSPGAEVRLRYGYYITCDEVVRDAAGEVVELLCSYDPESRGGSSPDGRKVKGTIHWVSAPKSLPCEIRVYDRLFAVPDPEADDAVDFVEHLNPESLIVRRGRVEPSVADDQPETRYQFERQGYFWRDPVDSAPGELVFNRIVSLKDAWAKIQKRADATSAPAPEKPQPAAASASKATERERPAKKAASFERDLAREENPLLAEKYRTYQSELGLDPVDADLLTASEAAVAFFEGAVAEYDSPNDLAKWMVNTLLPELGDGVDLDTSRARPVAVAKIVRRVAEGKITAAASREILLEVFESGKDPDAIITEKGLEKLTDPNDLAPIVDCVLAENSDELERYRDGKSSLFGFFIGKVMQATGGTADATVVRKLLQERL